MTTKKSGSKKAQTKNATPEIEAPVVEETPVVLSEGQIALRNALSKEFYEVEDYTTLPEDQLARIETWAKKMKAPKVKKAKPEKPPKRTAGRLIAPTLRVKDENAILKTVYVIKSILEDKNFKGGWGEATPESTLRECVEALEETITERKIADDTVEVVQQA